MKKKWWHDKVAYQIYPKSFFDSNGDGIGDLPGIIEKLDYLKDLGADILWLSPIYCSPLADQGYDISDYYNIDPRFGTMDDMDRLLAEAKKRDMHIVMDLVVNHCSDEHEWFKKACADPEGEYGQYFYLKKPEKAEAAGLAAASGAALCKGSTQAQNPDAPDASDKKWAALTPDGRVLPCNWRSYFGGRVWEKLPGHEDWYYLHVFHKKQPDLNWENPRVREEIYKMVNWWLDKGLSGFRIDAIMNIKKALPFKNYEPDRADGLCSINRMLHDATGIGTFLGELRDRCFAPHSAFTVGEVFNEKEGELPLFIGENGYFSTMFDFSETVWGSSPAGWHDNKDITPDAYKECIFSTQKKAGAVGFLSNIIENHDEPRGVSRYIPREETGNISDTAKKALATVYFFVRGLPWIYQGQEIGMENVPLQSIDEVDDIASLDAWNVMLSLGISEKDVLKAIEKFGRDNARTPFQWSAAPSAGFTTGTPWLRVNPDYPRINLEKQLADPGSVFNHYKKMTALRKDPRYRSALVYGSFEPYLEDEHNVIAYLRRSFSANTGAAGNNSEVSGAITGTARTDTAPPEPQTILVISNYQNAPRTLPLPAPIKRVLLDNINDNLDGEGLSTYSPEADSSDTTSGTGPAIHLQGYQTLVLELE